MTAPHRIPTCRRGARRARVLLAAAVLALLPVLPAAHADEGAAEGLVTRLFDVGALTRGVTSYLPGVLGTADASMVSDEENPLFGAEGEEPITPFGTIDELVEILQSTVDPVFWEVTEDAAIATLGETQLVVRATPAVQDGIAARLASLEQQALGCVRIEVVALAGVEADEAMAGPLAAERARALLASGRILRALSLVALPDQRATAWTGFQQAYVQDYDVEVASKSNIGDPIVGVARYGLEVRAAAEPSGTDGKLYLDLRVQQAERLPMAQHTLPVDTRIDLPRYRFAPIAFERTVDGGRWYVAPSATHAATPMLLLYRATSFPAALAPAAPEALPPWPSADTAPLAVRVFDVRDLSAAPRFDVSPDVYLVPSGFTPPEPPELEEPSPAMEEDALVDFLGAIAPSRTWNRTGARLEAMRGTLVVRQTPPVLDAIEAQIDFLRARYLGTTAVTLELLDVPTRMAVELLGAVDREAGLALPSRAAAGLEAALAAGDARRLGRLRVNAMLGTRKTVTEGTLRCYLQDYEVEIAEDSAIANPVIQRLFEGLVANVQPIPATGGRVVRVALRFTAARLEDLAQTPSPHGPIDTPTLAMLQSRSDVVVPLDRPAVVLAGGEGERTRILLLTASQQPR